MSPRHPTQGDTPTPTVARSELASVAYGVAEEVVSRSEDAHMRRCETDPAGPVCRVNERITEMSTRIGAIENALAEDRGARKRTAWVFVVVMAAIGAGTLGMQLIGLQKRDAQAHVNAAIVEQLHAIKAELGKRP